MAAQFADIALPERHQEDQLVKVPEGDYCCRIVQMFDPNESDFAEEHSADFVVSINKTAEQLASWTAIPWFGA